MEEIKNIKINLNNILKENFKNCLIAQEKPQIFKKVPAIIFKKVSGNLAYCLNYDIAKQQEIIQIDIWDKSSINAFNTFSKLEKILRQNGYLLEYSSEVPNDGNLFHIVNRFKINI